MMPNPRSPSHAPAAEVRAVDQPDLELPLPSPWLPFIFVGAVLIMTMSLLEGWIDITQGAVILAVLTALWMVWWVTIGEALSAKPDTNAAR